MRENLNFHLTLTLFNQTVPNQCVVLHKIVSIVLGCEQEGANDSCTATMGGMGTEIIDVNPRRACFLIMALFVQGKLKKVKPSAKNVVEKYKEVLDQTLRECRQPAELRAGLEAFLTAGKCVGKSEIVEWGSGISNPPHSTITKLC